MISKLLFTIESGWNRVKVNTKLALLGVSLFVLPLLFVVVLEQFYNVAESNIQTIEESRTVVLHDAAASLTKFSEIEELNNFLLTTTQNNDDITNFRVYSLVNANTVSIYASANVDEILATSTLSTPLQFAQIVPGDTYITPLIINDTRVDQSARIIESNGGTFYIFSEHDRSIVDRVLQKRMQDAYLLLTMIFAFLIGLAYWIAKQTDWERKHNKLAATLKERDLFTNMIAHEFRAPLTAIKGYASFLQESETMQKEEIRFADTIRESAERLVLLVNDFLEIARIQSGKLSIEIKTIDLRKPIQTVVTSLAEEAKLKNLQLVYTPDLKPQILETDENRFVQILTNIVSNSIKYTDSGTVEISCETDRTGITIRVKDTGMGISAEDQQKLFSPFARVGGVEKTATTGTGLGMWITKQMIDLLHGDIAVESIKEVGTHVVMHFKHSKH